MILLCPRALSQVCRVQTQSISFFLISEFKEERNTKLHPEQNDHNKKPLATFVPLRLDQQRSDDTISLQVRSFSELIKNKTKNKKVSFSKRI